jgi:hypothetical protein
LSWKPQILSWSRAKTRTSYSFQSDAFNSFLWFPQLQSIDKSILKCKMHWAYLSYWKD